MKKLLDLRFVIGVFFTIVGILLVVYFIFESYYTATNSSVNAWCGSFFILFGILMIAISYRDIITDEF